MARERTMQGLAPQADAIIRDELLALRDRIAANIIAEGANASGETIRGMEVITTRTDDGGVRGELLARPFFGALETGSRPWTNQYKHPPLFFRQIIQKWIDAKGLDMSAYLVARKIMREGSALYRDGGRDSIYSREIPATLDRLAERMAIFWAQQSLEHITLNTK